MMTMMMMMMKMRHRPVFVDYTGKQGLSDHTSNWIVASNEPPASSSESATIQSDRCFPPNLMLKIAQ